MPSDSTIKKNLQRAKSLCSMSDCSHKLGAVLMMGNKVISVGYNITKTHPIQKHYNLERGFNPNVRNNGQLHAEMMCLINAKNLDVDWSKTSLYVYRGHRDGSSALAKPCAACAKAIREKGIPHVYYSTDGIPYKEF